MEQDYVEMEQSDKKKSSDKRGFCQTNKCSAVILFLVLALVAAVVCVTLLDPGVREKVDSGPELWWKHTVIYQVYPRSFRDSDGDGIGDLKGVISKLSYFNDLGIGAIWLSPFFTSPMKDFGYDVSNYTDVDPIFGNIKDFQHLVTEAHNKGIKLIIDFVPNHSSNESAWFQKSRTAKQGDPYRDFYVWNNQSSKGIPPNNWESVFEGSAWTWDDVRGAYYYHAFLDSQPDLNYRSSFVRKQMANVLRFWLDMGVDGFRIDAIPHLFEIENQTINEPPGPANGFNPNLHKYTKNQPEIFDVVKEWRAIMDTYESDGQSRFLLAETVGIPDDARKKYYEVGSIPFYFDLIPVVRADCPSLAKCYCDKINQQLSVTDGQWPNFVIGNHDNKRVADRIGGEYVDAMNMMLLTLPGTPTTYYGEELGMRSGDYTGLPPQDPYAITSNNIANSRDPERNPMQWDTSTNAGFTNGSNPWLPIRPNTDYMHINVEVESKTDGSSLKLYKQLVKLRQGPDFQDTYFGCDGNNGLLSYQWGRLMISMNFGTKPEQFRLNDGATPAHREVVFSTSVQHTHTDMANISLQPGEGIIIRVS